MRSAAAIFLCGLLVVIAGRCGERRGRDVAAATVCSLK